MKHLPSLLLLTAFACSVQGAPAVSPSHADVTTWQAFNRQATHHVDHVHLNAKENDGVLWLRDFQFANGTIEFEVKGEDARGRSFVGVAFHGRNHETFDGVYFRPFNFRSPNRNAHSIQYISMPQHEWSTLRNNHPGRYENPLEPAPVPDDWIHVRIVVDHPAVTVFVNGADTAALQVDQLSDQGEGRVGFWVGNGSQGWFRHLKLIPAD